MRPGRGGRFVAAGRGRGSRRGAAPGVPLRACGAGRVVLDGSWRRVVAPGRGAGSWRRIVAPGRGAGSWRSRAWSRPMSGSFSVAIGRNLGQRRLFRPTGGSKALRNECEPAAGRSQYNARFGRNRTRSCAAPENVDVELVSGVADRKTVG